MKAALLHVALSLNLPVQITSSFHPTACSPWSVNCSDPIWDYVLEMEKTICLISDSHTKKMYIAVNSMKNNQKATSKISQIEQYGSKCVLWQENVTILF